MKILHVIDTLDIGGAERIAITLANIFEEQGHKVGILVILSSDHQLIKLVNINVKIYFLNRKNKLLPKYAKEISTISKNYELIQIHMRHNLRYLWFASIFSLIKWNKILFHDHYGNAQKENKIDFITKNIISKSIYIGVSKEQCKWAFEYCKVKKYYFLKNIIIKERIEEKHVQDSQCKRLVLVSNIHTIKNIEFAIQVFYELSKVGTFSLDIIGQISDFKYYNKLIDMIRSHDLTNAITFNHTCNNIQQILYKYDLALHTSRSETGPLVLVEYLAQSLPFLAFYTGEVVRHLEKDLNLLIIDSFKVQNWVDRIQMLLQRDRKKITKKMEAIYLKNYTSKQYYNRCLEIYQESLV